jgi:hypothetical protein
MDTLQRRRSRLLILAALTLLGLLLYPATRWIVRMQVATEGLRGMPAEPSEILQEVASRHPSDFAFQFADAAERDPHKLSELAARFPDQPSLYAAILRHGDFGSVYFPEDYLLTGQPLPSEDKRQNTISPEQLESLLYAAAQGEKRDPDNAFFPFLLSWGLFAAHRDQEALDAIRRVSAKPRWDDYLYDEFKARYKLDQEAFGERGSNAMLSEWAITLATPNYAQMRQMARVVTYRAVEAEQAGRTEEGLALRHALMHYGSLMRVQSRTLIGNLVGLAITAVGTSRPGGAPVVQRDANAPPLPADPASVQKHVQARQEKYYAYLRSIGKEEAARWAQAELESGRRQKAAASKALESSSLLADAVRLGITWAVGFFTLANLLSLLILGGAAALAAQFHPKRGVKILRLVFVLALTAGLFFWHYHAFEIASQGFLPLGTAEATVSSEDGEPSFWSRVIPNLLMVAIALTVPLLVVFVLCIISRLHRVPISAGVGRGLRGIAVPIACILMLIYGGTVLATAREEARENARLQRLVQHEGRFYFEATGNVWPGAIPEPQKE